MMRGLGVPRRARPAPPPASVEARLDMAAADWWQSLSPGQRRTSIRKLFADELDREASERPVPDRGAA